MKDEEVQKKKFQVGDKARWAPEAPLHLKESGHRPPLEVVKTITPTERPQEDPPQMVSLKNADGNCFGMFSTDFLEKENN